VVFVEGWVRHSMQSLVASALPVIGQFCTYQLSGSKTVAKLIMYRVGRTTVGLKKQGRRALSTAQADTKIVQRSQLTGAITQIHANITRPDSRLPLSD
jgi:hypothetical protein